MRILVPFPYPNDIPLILNSRTPDSDEPSMRTLATGPAPYPCPDDLPPNSTPDEPTTPSHRRTGENTLKTWVWATLPLILHFVSILTLTAFLTTYINGNDFNLQSRYDLSSKFSPLQSDITTAISSGIAIYRLFAMVWSAAMLWRCIFILMGKDGISLEQIDNLLTWQIHIHPLLRPSQGFGFLISMILLAAFPSQLSGPILTGSITWSSSYRLVRSQRATGIEAGIGNVSIESIPQSLLYPDTMHPGLWLISMASGFASIAWQDSLEDERTMKRVIRSIAQLPINSTLQNVTLPYFTLSKIEWIRDPQNELGQTVVNNISDWAQRFNMTNTFALIPGSGDEVFDSGIRSETRTIVGNFGYSPCTTSSVFGDLPANIGFLADPSGKFCLVYGRVTYVAGAAECGVCRVSSRFTVQNDTALTVLPSPDTPYVMNMMPMVAYSMAMQNSSLPQAYNNLDRYVTELLIRSYMASWTVVKWVTSDYQLSTDVHTAVPTSRANVLLWRVWMWLWLNLLFTISGFLFLFVQIKSGQQLVGNPSVAALLLDTSEILHKRDRAFCDFSTLAKDDKGIGYLRFKRNLAQGGHRQMEIIEQ